MKVQLRKGGFESGRGRAFQEASVGFGCRGFFFFFFLFFCVQDLGVL